MKKHLFAYLLLLPLLSLGCLHSHAQENASPLQVKIQELYVGILGRAADRPGLDYWTDQINAGVFTLENTRAAFTDPAQSEYTEIYGGLNNTQLVTAIYENFLERAPELTGLQYWVGELDNGRVNADQMINAVINAVRDPYAEGEKSARDLAVLRNKITAALYFTGQTQDNSFDAVFRGAAQAAVTDVTDKPVTLAESMALTDVYVHTGDNPVRVGGLISGDVYWTGVDPYVFDTRVEIAYGSTLYISGGASVYGEGYPLSVNGRLIVSGAPENKVELNDVTIRAGYRASEAKPFEININYANINSGAIFPVEDDTFGENIDIKGRFILRNSLLKDVPDIGLRHPILDSHIEYNTFQRSGPIRILTSDANVYIRNNLFSERRPFGNSGLPVNVWEFIVHRASFLDSVTIVEWNTFLGPGLRTVALIDLEQYSAAMTATSNYWDTENPLVIDKMIMDADDAFYLSHKLQYLPILVSPHPNTPK